MGGLPTVAQFMKFRGGSTMTIKNIKIKKLSKREIDRKRNLARQYRGITYSVTEDIFIVRVKAGTNIQNKPIYFKPVRRYNEFEKALKRWNEVVKMVKDGTTEEKIITFEDLHNKLKQILLEAKKAENNMAYGKSYSTIKGMITPFKAMEERAAKIYKTPILEITKNDVKAFLTEWNKNPLKSEKNTAENVNTSFARVRNALQIEAVSDLIDVPENIINILKTKLPVEKERKSADTKEDLEADKFFSFEEIKIIWKFTKLFQPTSIKNNEQGGSDVAKIIIPILIFTGIRIGEALGIKLKNVQKKSVTEGGFCIWIGSQRQGEKITAPKTEQSKRVIPIPEKIYNMILDYTETHDLSDEDLISYRVYNNEKNPVSAVTISNYFKAIEKNGNIQHKDKRGVHKFRAALTTYFRSMGIDENITNKFTGHIKKNQTVEEKHYIYEAPLQIEYIKFIAAQRTYMHGILENLPEYELPALYQKYYQQVLDEANGKKSLKKVLINNDAFYEMVNNIEAEYKEKEYDKIKNEYFKLNVRTRPAFEKFYREHLKREYLKDEIKEDMYKKICTERKVRLQNGEKLELNYIENTDEQMFYREYEPDWWLMEEVSNSHINMKYIYKKGLPKEYTSVNSYEDFLFDVWQSKEETIDEVKSLRTEGLKQNGTNMDFVFKVAKYIMKHPKFYKKLKPVTNSLTMD